MTTMEKMFVSIFDKSNSIIDQFKQHGDSYDQYLASKCLIQGLKPPDWLWNCAGDAGFQDLKKEDLISGLLFPLPRAKSQFTHNRNTVFYKTVSAVDNGQPSEGSFAGTCASNKYCHPGDSSKKDSLCHPIDKESDTGRLLEGVPEIDHDITSSRDQMDRGISYTDFEPDQSLSRIQRSRSRQKALELRNSGKENSKKRSRGDPYSGRITRSRTSEEQPDHVKELSEMHISQPSRLSSFFNEGIVLQNDLPGQASKSSRSGPKELVQCDPFANKFYDGITNSSARTLCSEELLKLNALKAPSARPMFSRFAPLNISFQAFELLNGVGKHVPDVQVGASNVISEYLVSRPSTEDSIPVQPKTLIFDDDEDDLVNDMVAPDFGEEKHMESVEGNASQMGRNVTSMEAISSDHLCNQKSNIDEISVNILSIEGLSRNEIGEISLETFEDETHSFINSSAPELELLHTSVSRIKSLSAVSSAQEQSGTHLGMMVPDTAPENSRTPKHSLPPLVDNSREEETVAAEKRPNILLENVLISAEPYVDNGDGIDVDAKLPKRHQPSEPCNIEAEETSYKVHEEESLELDREKCECQLQAPLASNTICLSAPSGAIVIQEDFKEQLTEVSSESKTILREGGKFEFSPTDVPAKLTNIDMSSSAVVSLCAEPEISFESHGAEPEIPSEAQGTEHETSREAQGTDYPSGLPETLNAPIVTLSFVESGVTSYEKADDGLEKHMSSSIEKSVEIEKILINTWPQYKQQKIENQFSNMYPTSSRAIRAKRLKQVDEPHPFGYFGTSVKLQEMNESLKRRKLDLSGSSAKLQPKEGELDVERETVKVNLVDISNMPIVNKEESVNSQGCLNGKIELSNSTRTLFPFASEDDQNSLHFGEDLEMGNIKETTLPEEESIPFSLDVPQLFAGFDFIGSDETMPEFKEYSIDATSNFVMPDIGGRQNSILDNLCIDTPLLHPFKYKCHLTPDMCQSLPVGFLNSSLFDDDYKTTAEEIGKSIGRSYSDFMPWRHGMTPYTPPIGKFSQKINLVSTNHSSEKQHCVNPDLTCFRIDEDSCSSDENGSLLEAAAITETRKRPSSTRREPLLDLTNINLPVSVSSPLQFHSRDSLESVDTKLSSNETQMFVEIELTNGYKKDKQWKTGHKENQNSLISGSAIRKFNESRQKRSTRHKENHNSLISGSAIRKPNESRQNRFSKPTPTVKASEQKTDRPKRNNIVSNVSSFVPLVQAKKQLSAVFPAKRDIKVKALEAAEVAKRIEEQKENDRRTKKEAAKLERARMEQEKVRQNELKKKMKEDEHKKKEAEKAKRKRLRDEDERKEKERKRKCTEELRRQQKDQEERLRAEKERRGRPADKREGSRKELQDEDRKRQKTGKENEKVEYVQQGAIDSRQSVVSVGDQNVLDVLKGTEKSPDFAKPKVSSTKFNLLKGVSTSEDDASVIFQNREQSYDISPYQCSDDDEEEVDDMLTRKVVPLWAREKYLAPVLPAIQLVDPLTIFPKNSFCSIAECFRKRDNRTKSRLC